MQNFVFRCPVRGVMVQGWTEEEDTGSTRYLAHSCLGCGGVHLVNPKTGKLMSEERPPRKKPD
jgi:hypothetical protein